MTNNESQLKPRVAVIYGGRTPEHDVSIATALQAFNALDRSQYEPFLLYIDTAGRWWVGDELAARNNYLPDENTQKRLTEVSLDITPGGGVGLLAPLKGGLFGGKQPLEFDVALLCVHGVVMEDGGLQGLFELADIPYTGMRHTAATVAMDKVLTKHLLRSLNLPHLPCQVLERPAQGLLIDEKDLKAQLKSLLQETDFPLLVKPVHLGSSIGVAKVSDCAELSAALPSIFELDWQAMVEPFVPNLIEYNIAVSRALSGTGEVVTSAIESPKTTEDLLDFKQKYVGQGSKKGTKQLGRADFGMLSMTREINPKLSAKLEKTIRQSAVELFQALGGTGAPRIDFLCNRETGEIWLNEINPCPGDLGFFLWEVATPKYLFPQQLRHQLDEAAQCRRRRLLPTEPVPNAAWLFKRPGI